METIILVETIIVEVEEKVVGEEGETVVLVETTMAEEQETVIGVETAVVEEEQVMEVGVIKEAA